MSSLKADSPALNRAVGQVELWLVYASGVVVSLMFLGGGMIWAPPVSPSYTDLLWSRPGIWGVLRCTFHPCKPAMMFYGNLTSSFDAEPADGFEGQAISLAQGWLS